MNILFLGLKIFGATGGIEQVNRNWLFALTSLHKKHNYKWKSISMYDNSIDTKYVDVNHFDYCKGNRWIFGFKSIWAAINANVVIISHLNLSLFVLIAKLVNPRLKIVVQLHGIEAWANLSGVQERLLFYADKILAVSKFTKESIVNRYPDLSEKLLVLHNSLDPLKTYTISNQVRVSFREKHSIAANDKLIITVGRLSAEEAYKGYDKTIEAIAKLKNPTIKYHIIGKSDEAEKTRVEKIIKEHGLVDTVKLIGFVQDDVLDQYYQSADLFVMPSKGEGFGLVFIDAMAMGLRVIGGNVDGSVDAITPFEESLLVNPDDVDSLAQHINIILNKKWEEEDKIKLSEKCKEIFSANHFERNIDKIIL